MNVAASTAAHRGDNTLLPSMLGELVEVPGRRHPMQQHPRRRGHEFLRRRNSRKCRVSAAVKLPAATLITRSSPNDGNLATSASTCRAAFWPAIDTGDQGSGDGVAKPRQPLLQGLGRDQVERVGGSPRAAVPCLLTRAGCLVVGTVTVRVGAEACRRSSARRRNGSGRRRSRAIPMRCARSVERCRRGRGTRSSSRRRVFPKWR